MVTMKIKNNFQNRVAEWVETCFGIEISKNASERSHRFLEEALELVQAAGCSEDEAILLVHYVYSRPRGQVEQETGGVMLTLAALSNALNIDMQQSGFDELSRVWRKIEKIRQKRLRKLDGLPLP
jgi:NTP pyrophosphatase (non-canonical NTP hydrolase)